MKTTLFPALALASSLIPGTAMATDAPEADPSQPPPPTIELSPEQLDRAQLGRKLAKAWTVPCVLGMAMVPGGFALADSTNRFRDPGMAGVGITTLGMHVAPPACFLAIMGTTKSLSALEDQGIDGRAARNLIGAGTATAAAGLLLVYVDDPRALQAALAVHLAGGGLVVAGVVTGIVMSDRGYRRATQPLAITPTFDPQRQMPGLAVSGRLYVEAPGAVRSPNSSFRWCPVQAVRSWSTLSAGSGWERTAPRGASAIGGGLSDLPRHIKALSLARREGGAPALASTPESISGRRARIHKHGGGAGAGSGATQTLTHSRWRER